jgi:tetratricopeptide (TPR) repeat protein
MERPDFCVGAGVLARAYISAGLFCPRYNVAMSSIIYLLILWLCLTSWAAAQSIQDDKGPGQNQAPPRSDRDKEAGESSSRETRIDLTPPKNDAKEHPNSGPPISEADEENSSGEVQEFHAWNPHKALKDIEVGDFYFKRKNYQAALDRYREALVWKSNDAIANFRMAQCFEKLGKPDEAVAHYRQYLQVLPHGPLAEEAHKAVQKFQRADQKSQKAASN